MALLQSIVDRSRRNRSAADLGHMSDRQLEDLGLCRADIRQSKPRTSMSPMRANEAWPTL
ncbi:MAG: hypothetical protein ACI89J_001056 [Hyphomicrobiaceae bacterium]|jgi:uncharacterized protein YjiS (DUF1127 family)